MEPRSLALCWADKSECTDEGPYDSPAMGVGDHLRREGCRKPVVEYILSR